MDINSNETGLNSDNIKEAFVTGLTTNQEHLDDISEITAAISDDINKQLYPRNRKERRALAKRLGKKGKGQLDIITETARKLNYIDLIQKMRKINEEKEKEKNEAIENRNIDV